MMMKTNVQLLCEDLDQLLKDICDYLTTQTNDDNMTENQRLFANKLIQRSKKQLQQISKVSMALSADVDDQSYVDMNKQSAAEVEEITYEESEDNEYTPIECPSLTSTEDICPFESLPAIELEKCEKFGHIDRKGRFLFIGHQKKLFAGIKANWLLLYATKKDNKPLEKMNLTNFTAKPADSSKTKIFELKCIRSEKAFQFVAQTPKDMVQWVACINKRSIVQEKNQETNPTVEDENEEENVYEQLKNEEPIDTLKKKSKPLPPLPKPAENTYVLRHPKPETPQLDQESYDPVCPPNPKDDHLHDDDDDEEQIYDVIQEIKVDKSTKPKDAENSMPINKPIERPKLDERSRTDSSFTNSFSDDDEEAIYDVLEQRPPDKFTTKPIARQIDSEPEEEYCNLVQNPMRRSPVIQQVDDAEEAYLNIVPNVNRAQIPSSRKNNVTPKHSTFTLQVEEPEEEYSNLIAIVNTTNKAMLPKLPLRSNVNIEEKRQDYNVDDEDLEEVYDCIVQPPKSNILNRNKEVNKHIKVNISAQDFNVDDKDVEEEYDCIVHPPNNPPKSNIFTRNKDANKHTKTNISSAQMPQDSNVDDKDVEEEYDCIVQPPNNPPKSNIFTRNKGVNKFTKTNISGAQKPQDSNVDDEDVEEEYDCIVSQPKNAPKSLVQARIKEVNSHTQTKQSSKQTDKTKKEPPALKPKPKSWKGK